MPDTRLILHVKGTEADTQELPKEEVKAAIAEGKLTESQLIWSVADNAWKQVREWPDLAPGETLILHVKGTEAETRQLPKKAIRAAVSQGDITHSQLIWSTKDSAWKQVRELPDLMPGETLILHVKGTESQTEELPKEAIRSQIAQGKITQSQLIWNTAENAWKQVREWPDLAPGETMILHVKGTEAQTTELPKKAIRVGISQGKITHSQLIWNPNENAWKQVRQMPELLPSQKLAPAPKRTGEPPRVLDGIMPETPNNPVARAAAAVQGPPRVKVSVGQPRVAVAGEATATPRVAEASVAPQVRVQAAATAVSTAPQVRAAAAASVSAAPKVQAAVPAASAPTAAAKSASHIVKEKEQPHFLKLVCIGLGILILVVMAANYLLVDRPLVSSFKESQFKDVTVYAHYGAFMQPTVIVVHIPRSAKITPDNITDFLVELANDTPDNLLTNNVYSRVALTSGWTAQYTFTGFDWKKLGSMNKQPAAERKEFIMSQMADAGGQPVQPESTLNFQAQEAKREKIWQAFVSHFSSPQP